MDKNALIFYEEAIDLLVKLESLLLDLEKNTESAEYINEVFRTLHTLKGSGSMFGFNQLADFVHNIENTFSNIRQGRLNLTQDIVNLTLEAKDLMRLLIDTEKQTTLKEKERIEEITQAYAFLTNKSAANSQPEPSLKDQSPREESNSEPEGNTASLVQQPLNNFRIYFRPHPEFYSTGNDPLIILKELTALGETNINVDTSHVPELETIDPEKSYLAWEIDLRTKEDENSVRDVFIFVEDICELRIETGKPSEEEEEENHKSLTLAKNDVENTSANDTTPNKDINIPDKQQASKSPILSEQQNVKTLSPETGLLETSNSSAAIKVDSSKLDRLISLLGELVTVQARLSQIADNRGNAELITLAQELDALTSDLRDSALKLSMLPISSFFPQLENLVNTTAARENKQASIIFKGGNTELDKGIMSKLFAPLSQLITFCIEDEQRNDSKNSKTHKSKASLIEFSAWHSSGNVCISITDNNHIDDSTNNSKISDIRRLIEELRGHLDCKFTAGRETVYIIRIPLNLAIIEGLMVRLEERLFVFPLSLVEECIELTDEDQAKNFNKNVVMLRGHIIPYIKLRNTFNIAGKPPKIQQVVITNVNHQRVGFTVDQVVGEYQTVIKSWGKFCNDIPGITGATILGDGTVALIADLAQLINEERHNIELETEVSSNGI